MSLETDFSIKNFSSIKLLPQTSWIWKLLLKCISIFEKGERAKQIANLKISFILLVRNRDEIKTKISNIKVGEKVVLKKFHSQLVFKNNCRINKKEETKAGFFIWKSFTNRPCFIFYSLLLWKLHFISSIFNLAARQWFKMRAQKRFKMRNSDRTIPIKKCYMEFSLSTCRFDISRILHFLSHLLLFASSTLILQPFSFASRVSPERRIICCRNNKKQMARVLQRRHNNKILCIWMYIIWNCCDINNIQDTPYSQE